MSAWVLENARLIDPLSESERSGALALRDGRVINPADLPADARRVDLGGAALCPGLVDLWARPGRLSAGHHGEPGAELRAARGGGITRLCLPPDTAPPLDQPAQVAAALALGERALAPRLYPYAALTRELGGEQLAELASLAAAGCVATSQGDAPLADNRVLYRTMAYAATHGLTVVLHPACSALRAHGVAHAGPTALRLGLAGEPAAAEAVAAAAAIECAAATGARLHLNRVSAARTLRWIRQARADGQALTADACIHHLWLDETALIGYRVDAKLVPPLRAASDREALREGLLDGTVDALCSDHRPHAADSKQVPFASAAAGASGLDTLLPLTLALGRELGLSRARALRWISTEPALLLGQRAPDLAVGSAAELCVFDPDLRWTVGPDTLHSAGHNSPWAGNALRGRALASLRGLHWCVNDPAPGWAAALSMGIDAGEPGG